VKIAFLGTHGVGKTTLCFDVAARPELLAFHRTHNHDTADQPS